MPWYGTLISSVASMAFLVLILWSPWDRDEHICKNCDNANHDRAV